MFIIINHEEFEIITNELQYKENETDLEYALRTAPLMDRITHWMAKEDKQENEEFIQKDKVYKFYQSPADGEYVIEHDNGEESLSWMTTEGDYLIKKN